MRMLSPRQTVGMAMAALLLGGCGGAPAPKALPKPTEPASPTASATPTPPALPKAAKAKTDEAVSAFARHYVEVINYATASGDVGKLLVLADESCTSCYRLAKRLRTIYGNGGKIRSRGWRVTGTLVIPNQPLARKYIDITIVQSPQTLVERAGAASKKYPGGKQALSLLLARRAESWKVTRMTLAG